jgi:hypothetical protein
LSVNIGSFNISSKSYLNAYQGNDYLGFVSIDTINGTFPITSFSGSFPNSSFTDQSFTLQPAGSTITYTSFPLAPGDVLGSYILNLIGAPSGHNYTVTGSFKVPRYY